MIIRPRCFLTLNIHDSFRHHFPQLQNHRIYPLFASLNNMKHFVRQFIFSVNLPESFSCFFPSFCVYFHRGSFLIYCKDSVVYSTGGATFQVSTKFSITSGLNLQDKNITNLIGTIETNILEPLIEQGLIDSYEKTKKGLRGLKYTIKRLKKGKPDESDLQK